MLLLLEVLLLLVAIKYHNGIFIKRNFLRQAIVMPSLLLWTHLYHNADDNSFFTMTGVIREVFNMLLAIVYPPSDPSAFRYCNVDGHNHCRHIQNWACFYFSLAVQCKSNIFVYSLDVPHLCVHVSFVAC